MDGLIRFGQRSVDLAGIRLIPLFWDKPVAAFKTHAVNPENTAEKLARALAKRGSLSRSHSTVGASN